MKDEDPTQPSSSGFAPAGGATGIFGTIAAETKPQTQPAPNPIATPPQPLSSPPSAAVSSAVPQVLTVHEVVFQAPASPAQADADSLRRILESPSVSVPLPTAVSTHPAALPSPAVGGGGFTQLLRTLTFEPPQMTPHETPEAVTQEIFAPRVFNPATTEVATNQALEPRPATISPAPAVGSFTKMFESSAAQNDAVPEDRAVSAYARSAEPMTPRPEMRSSLDAFQAAAPAALQPPAIGGFTQLFRALETPPPLPGMAAAPNVAAPAKELCEEPSAQPQVVEQNSESLTQLPRTHGQTTPVAPVPGPVFSTPPVSIPAVPAPAAPAATIPAQAEGSFTQLFRALDPASGSSAPPQPSSAFTPSGPAQGSGSFTQMYSALNAAPSEDANQADAFPPLPSARDAQHFRDARYGASAEKPDYLQSSYQPADAPLTYGPPNTGAANYPPASYLPPGFPGTATPQPAATVSSQPAIGGGLTQLLRTLDGPSAPASVPQPPLVPYSDPSHGSFQAGPAYGLPNQPASSSGATSTFSQPLQPHYEAPPPQQFNQGQPDYSSQAPYSTPPVPSGPGEFTKILNASAFRESLRQVQSGPAPTAAAQSVPPAQAAPPGYPPMPGYPPPAYPAMPGYPPMQSAPQPPQAGAAYPMQTPPMQMPHLQPPVAPAVPAAPQPGGLAKSWVPILLIAIIVLLVGILLAVVLMRK